MNATKNQNLWDAFLKDHEENFKKYLGYGKEEIEKIGIDEFFNAMGWEKEEQFESYMTDKMHVIPCIQCGKKFAVYEENFGLCEECAKNYDLDEFAKFSDYIRTENGEKAAKDLIAAFFLSEEYRDCFKAKDGSLPEFAWVAKGNKAWRIVPLQELLKVLTDGTYKKIQKGMRYQIVLHDQSYYEENGEKEFTTIDVAAKLATQYPDIFQHKNT